VPPPAADFRRVLAGAAMTETLALALAAAAAAADAARAAYDSGVGSFSALYEANAAVNCAAVALGAGINAADNEVALGEVAAVLAAGGVGGRPELAAALAALGEAGRIDRRRAVEVLCNPAAGLAGGEVVIEEDGVGYSLWGHPVYW
jgi:hypothetical protein